MRALTVAAVFAAVALVACALPLTSAGTAVSFPVAPFTRQLTLQSPPMQGADVVVLQNLLQRGISAPALAIGTNGTYDAATADAVRDWQAKVGLQATGDVDAATAAKVLAMYSRDGYKDDGRPASERGYLYKVHLPVHRNRSIETTATLYDAHNNVLYTFTARAHGNNYLDEDTPWPNFNNSIGLNEFSPRGATPTGLSEFDLNSPEDIPRLYGPYPVNRMVQGLEGNAAFLVPNIRDGILLHTGEWAQYSTWREPEPMPNSGGCIHAYPETIKAVWDKLVALGVKVNPNTDGKLPYPYKSQGLISVELVD